MQTRYQNLCAILTDFDQRGITCREVGGELRFKAAPGVLSEGEVIGIELCRAGLTEAYRRRKGLCISCGLDGATQPFPGGKYPIKPLWCRMCWEAGRWKER